ncbi:MAG: hypothetical protein KF865_08870 [Bdellovibrionaceae bacterium]|nr:hypothetical protein [Pseudobdellovibrionaceae bacterium]
MKLRFWSGVSLAGLALAACASTNPSSPHPAPVNPAQVENPRHHVITLKEGDRLPSAAPTIVWKPDTVRLDINNKTHVANTTAAVKQVMIWEELVNYTSLEYRDREFAVNGTCYDLICSQGSGKSDLWDNYHRASRAAKAAALENAIKGIGEVSAKQLVAKNYFSTTPRSWNAFVDEIKRAAANDVITKSVQTQVTITYRAENALNLGYGPNACTERAYSCTKWIVKSVEVPVERQRLETRQKIVSQKNFDVSATISNALLMDGENEALSLRINENGVVLDSSIEGKFNRYDVSSSLSGDRVMVNVTGTHRVLRNLPSNVVLKDAFEIVNDTPVFVVDIDPAFLPKPQEDENSQLVMDYTVKTCNPGWVGTCAAFGGDRRTQAIKSHVLSGQRTIIPVEVPKGRAAWIEFTLSRRNSLFFNDKATSVRTTESVKMK